MGTVLEIGKNQDSYAKNIAAKLDVSINRKIALIDILGITIFAKFLKSHSIKPDLTYCMHKFPFAIDKYKITDVNYNGHIIYVATVFNQNYIKIPKFHFELGIQPDFYVIAEVHKSVAKGVIGGYIEASSVKRCISDEKYYYIQKNDISDIDELIRAIKIPNEPRKTHGKHLLASSMFVKLIDNELPKKELDGLVKHLLTCENCRIRLTDVMQFDRVLSPQTSFLDDLNKVNVAKAKNSGAKFLKFEDVISKVKTETVKPIPQVERINKTKETIDLIFKNKKMFDLDFSYLPSIDWQAKRKILTVTIASFVILLMLITGANIKHTSENLKPIDAIEATEGVENFDEADFYDSVDYFESNDIANLDYSISNSTSTKLATLGVKNVSWEVDKSISEKQEYTNFLQIIGKNIRLNMQNELLTATDFPQNHLVKVGIKISNGGKVTSLKMNSSSGSGQIDDIIQKCIYETFSYIKPPSSGFMNKSLDMVLVIEL